MLPNALKEFNQNLLDIVIPSGIGVFHTNQLKSMLFAYLVLLTVTPADDLIVPMRTGREE